MRFSFCAVRTCGRLTRGAVAVLVVLVGVAELVRAGHARERAERDAVVGELVAQVAAIGIERVGVIGHVALGHELAAVDGDLRSRSKYGIDSPVVREVAVAEDDDRRLELVGEVEGLPRELERVLAVAGRQHDARELALGGVDDVAQVGLLGPGWQGRSRGLDA